MWFLLADHVSSMAVGWIFQFNIWVSFSTKQLSFIQSKKSKSKKVNTQDEAMIFYNVTLKVTYCHFCCIPRRQDKDTLILWSSAIMSLAPGFINIEFRHKLTILNWHMCTYAAGHPGSLLAWCEKAQHRVWILGNGGMLDPRPWVSFTEAVWRLYAEAVHEQREYLDLWVTGYEGLSKPH